LRRPVLVRTLRAAAHPLRRASTRGEARLFSSNSRP
jgi:hypothetical protein